MHLCTRTRERIIKKYSHYHQNTHTKQKRRRTYVRTVRVPRSTPYSLSTYCSSMGDISTPGSSPPDSALSFRCCSSCSSTWTTSICSSSSSSSRGGTRGTSGKRGWQCKDKEHEIGRGNDQHYKGGGSKKDEGSKKE